MCAGLAGCVWGMKAVAIGAKPISVAAKVVKVVKVVKVASRVCGVAANVASRGAIRGFTKHSVQNTTFRNRHGVNLKSMVSTARRSVSIVRLGKGAIRYHGKARLWC